MSTSTHGTERNIVQRHIMLLRNNTQRTKEKNKMKSKKKFLWVVLNTLVHARVEVVDLFLLFLVVDEMEVEELEEFVEMLDFIDVILISSTDCAAS